MGVLIFSVYNKQTSPFKMNRTNGHLPYYKSCVFSEMMIIS